MLVIVMSVSVSMKGRTRGEMKKGIHSHQVRTDKKTGIEASKHSDSDINPELTHLNVSYFDEDRFPAMRKKLDAINQDRKDAGKKKLYKSANTFMTGNVQLSDESLARLGWKWDEDGKKLPADKQSEKAVHNVKLAYADIIQSMKKQPEVYGDIFSATLHLDEGSPHIDFLSDPINVERQELAAHYLNGPKGTPKGKLTSEMQDKALKYSRFPEETREKFDLKRGLSNSKKVDMVKNLRKEEKRIDKKAAAVNELEKQATKKADDIVNGAVAAVETLSNNVEELEKQKETLEKTLKEKRNEANQAYRAKKYFDEQYNARWGTYKDKMAELREQHEKIWKNPDARAKWDEAAEGLRNAKQLQYFGEGSGFIGAAFQIIGMIQEHKYSKQMEIMKEERKKALDSVEEQRKALKAEMEKYKEEMNGFKLEMNVARDERNEVQSQLKTVKTALGAAKSELLPFQKKANDTLNEAKKMKSHMASSWNTIREQVQNGALDIQKVKKVMNEYDPVTPENLREFAHQLDDLSSNDMQL